jgi:uncharacterized membrane protein YhaH (DUF805 family)
MVGFAPAIKRGFRQMFVWRGRATRSEFWFFVLFFYLCLLVTVGICMVALLALVFPVTLVVIVVFFFPVMAVLVRRLHDTGRDAGCFWIIALPYIGWLILIVFLCQSGDEWINEYGPPPFAQEPVTE